jgi:hypothetical protein
VGLAEGGEGVITELVREESVSARPVEGSLAQPMYSYDDAEGVAEGVEEEVATDEEPESAGVYSKTLKAFGPPQVWEESPPQAMLQFVEPRVAPFANEAPQ